MRLQVMRRAAAIGVSAACREVGISRTLFNRWQHRLSRYGVDGLHPRRLHARPGPAPQLPPAVERRLLAVAIAEATWGAARLAAYAQRLWRISWSWRGPLWRPEKSLQVPYPMLRDLGSREVLA